ncbi:hypothetical protein ACVFI8_11790 [Agarivorans sp. MS3-6]
MLLQEIVEIISFTDSDLLSETLESFNQHGIVTGDELPFLTIVYEQAPQYVIKKLTDVGFKGALQIVKLETSASHISYLVFDTARYTLAEAMQWFEAKRA